MVTHEIERIYISNDDDDIDFTVISSNYEIHGSFFNDTWKYYILLDDGTVDFHLSEKEFKNFAEQNLSIKEINIIDDTKLLCFQVNKLTGE